MPSSTSVNNTAKARARVRDRGNKRPNPGQRVTKRAQTVCACDQYRKKRQKCDGARPTCGRCQQQDNSQCQYSVPADETRSGALKREVKDLRESTADVRRLLVSLASLPEEQALEWFAQLRHTPSLQSDGDLFEQTPLSSAPLQSVQQDRGNVSRQMDTSDVSSLSTWLTKRSTVNSPQTQAWLAADLANAKDSEITRMLLNTLVRSSDTECGALLARLRLGDDWTKIAHDIKQGHLIDNHDSRAIQTDHEVSLRYCDREWLGGLFDRDHFMRIGKMDITSLPGQALPSNELGIRFGNLTFSSAIKCNQYPADIQQRQERNFFLPAWAMRPVVEGTGTLDPFEALFTDIESHIARGVSVEDLCGTHAFLGALDDEVSFSRAPLLSQQLANIVHDIKPDYKKDAFTRYALMHWYWSLWRWMLQPGPENYREIPICGRPTPYQLFMPHPRVFDLIIPPSLRDLMCQAETPDVRWFSEGAATIQCDWSGPLDAAISRNAITNELELSPIAKAHIARIGGWSLGPTVRPYLKDVDSHILIRSFDPSRAL